MKKFLKVFFFTLGILLVLCIIRYALILCFFGGVNPHIPDPIYSPDRQKVVIPTVNLNNKDDYATYLLVNLEIQDTQSGKTIFQVQTRASHRMQWSVYWIDNTTIRLDSSDIGPYCWKDENGAWGKAKCP